MPARLRVALTAAALTCTVAVPALAAPSQADLALRTGDLPAPLRIFPEPLTSTGFIQYTANPATGESQYLDGIAELESRYPKVVDVDELGELVGMPAVRSAGGRSIPVITLTDESVPDEGKVDLYISMSIHGIERAGLEGSTRFMEDLAAGWYTEEAGGAKYLLTNGDPKRPYFEQMDAHEVLRKARVVFTDLNPDGWAAGEAFNNGVLFSRGNKNGIDLNRQWPTQGWHNSGGQQYNTGKQPEAQMGRKLIEEYLAVPEGAADLHGMGQSNVLLAIMFPAGQFDPRQLAKQAELAESIKYNVNNSVLPGAAGALNGQQVQPADYHTAYDAIGYDDSGFQGDYLVQQGILEMDHEYMLSNTPPNSVFIPALEQIHVDTTRELLKATIVTTIVNEEIKYSADLKGRVGYVENPEVLSSEDGGLPTPPFGLEQQPYTSTSMEYYRDLAQYTNGALTPVTSDAVAAGTGLAGLDTVVITDRELPRFRAADGSLQEPDRSAFWGAVKAFAEAGGNVVLTDSAMKGLADLGIVAPNQVTKSLQYAGAIENVDREHPLLSGVNGVVGQTYFEVPLGYRLSPSSSPHWSVDSAAWQAKGGTTAATIGTATTRTGLGTVPLGRGLVSVFGAILPNATQAYAHTYGLADYAVTYAGNAILVNALTYARPAS